MVIKTLKRTDIEVDSEYTLSLECRAWLYESKIKRYSWFTDVNNIRYISFAYEQDAMAFKLRWL